MGNRYCDMKIITRQQFSAALLKPLMDLIFVTSRAMSVPAGMIDINLFTASVTMINMPAHRLCSALLDVSDGSFMRSEHGTREPLQVQWPELTHDLCQFDCHHQLFKRGCS